MDTKVGASDGGASGDKVPLVVCVSADAAVVERVLRQLDGIGRVVSCPGLAELRTMLFPSPGSPTSTVRPITAPTAPQEPPQPT